MAASAPARAASHMPQAPAPPSQAEANRWCAEAAAGKSESFEAPTGSEKQLVKAFGAFHLGSGFVENEKGRFVVARVTGQSRPFGLLKLDDTHAPAFEGKQGVPAIFYAIAAVSGVNGDESLIDLLVSRAPYGAYARQNCMHQLYHADTRSFHEYSPSDVASDNGRLQLSLRLDDWKPPSDIDVHCAAAWYGNAAHFTMMRAGDKKQLNGRGGVDGMKLVFDTATKRFTCVKLATYKGTECDLEPIFFAAAAGRTDIVQWFAADTSGIPGQTTTCQRAIHSVKPDGHGGYVLVEGGSGSGGNTPNGNGAAAAAAAKGGAAKDDAPVRNVTPAEVAKANAHADTAHALEGGNRNCQSCSASDCVIA